MRHLSTEQVAELRQQLVEERNRLLQREASTSREPQTDDAVHDVEEMAADEARRANAHATATRDRQRIDEVDLALQRMSNGNYGICQQTGDPIPFERLQIDPATRYTVEGIDMLQREQVMQGFPPP